MHTHPAFSLFDEALRSGAEGFERIQVLEVVAIRVSTESLAKLDSHLQEGGRLYFDHPVLGPWLDSLPDDILTNPDDSYRREYGLGRIELRHCHRTATSRSRVGYAAVVKMDDVLVLVLLVAHSGGQEDIETLDGPVNAWGELVVAAWNWAAAARKLRFQRDTRMNRSNSVFARIDSAVKNRPGGRYFWGEKEIDPHRDSWQAVITGNKSTEESEAGKTSRLAGILRRLQKGLWPYKDCPIGLRRASKPDVTGRMVEDRDGTLVPDATRQSELEGVLRAYAGGASKTLIACDAALLGARDGDGALLLPKIVPVLDTKKRHAALQGAQALHAGGAMTAAELTWVEGAVATSSTSPGREAATQIANHYVTRIVDGARQLRSGTVQVLRFGAQKGRTDYLGWSPSFVVDDADTVPSDTDGTFIAEPDLPTDHPYWSLSAGKQAWARSLGFWYFTIESGTPVELPDSTWAQIEQRKSDDGEKVRRRAASGRARPLAGLRSLVDNGVGFRLRHGGDPATYSIEGPTVAPMPDTTAALGTERSGDVAEYPSGTKARAVRSDNGSWDHLHTIGATHAARQLGELVLRVVDRVEAGPLPLLPRIDDATSRVDPTEQELKALQDDLANIAGRLEAYARSLAGMTAESRRYRSTCAARDADEERADELETLLIPKAQLRLAQSPAAGDSADPEPELVQGDFAHLTLVGLGLLRCDPYGPAALTDAVTWMLDSGRGLSNLRREGESRRIFIDVAIRVPMLDGSVEWMEAGTLDLTDRRLAPDRLASYRDEAARRLLRDGESVHDLTSRYGWDTSKVLTEVTEWLADHGLGNHYLRACVATAAAADPAIPVPSVVYAELTHDNRMMAELRLREGDWIVDNILNAYGLDASWAHGSGWVRKPLTPWRSMLAAIAAAGPTRVEDLIASVEGINNHEQLKDNLHPGRCSHWQPPARLDNGWVHPYFCSREACPGGLGSPMTGFLPVPELVRSGDAVFCTHCWHTKTSVEPLPGPYRLRWDVLTAVMSLRRADGVPHVGAAVVTPTVGVSLLDTREAAKLLSAPVWWIQNLAKAGLIPSTRTLGGDFRFNPRLLDSSAVRSIANSPPNADDGHHLVDDGKNTSLLGSAAAGERLGIDRWYVRFLVRSDALSNHGTTDAPAFAAEEIEGLLGVVRERLGIPFATLADVVVVTELAKRWGFTTSVIKRMIAEGVLAEVMVGQLTFVARTSVSSLDDRSVMALDPSVRLSADDVAARAGLSTATVLHHVVTGALAAVQFYPRGKYLFLPAEVDEWLEVRRLASIRRKPAPQA